MSGLSDITTTTPAKYLFKLVTDTETIICNPEPLEWKSGTLEMKRDLNVGGVFSTFQMDSLTFVGNGAKLLKALFETYELNAKCTLIVYWWKSSTRSYVEFPSRFDINFNFYEIVKVGRFAFGVRVKAINSSTQTKLDNRQDIDVDLNKLVSIGGTTITDYPALKKGLYYLASNVYYEAKLNSANPKGWDMANKRGIDGYCSIPLTVISKDYDEVNAVPYIAAVPNTSFIASFFNTALYDYEFELNYYLKFIVGNAHTPTAPWTVKVVEVNKIGVHDNIINTYDLGSFGNDLGLVIISGDTTINATKGNSLKLVCSVAGIAGTQAFLTAANITITQTVTKNEATLTEGFPVYEALERTLQHVLDTQYPFYSAYFGRTDTIYNAQNSVYSSENQLRFAHIQSGLNQRGIKLDNHDSPLAVNFKDLFSSLKAIYNVGYSLETIDNFLRVRIEEYAYFFQNTEALDISARISKYDIQSQVMPELVPVDIKSGFESYEYLSLNGMAEPNTTNQRTSIMNTASKFENISKLRGDTKGIMDNLANPVNQNSSTDTKGDSDIFIVKSQRDATHGWKPEKLENITVTVGTSLFKEDLLNRYFTPSRMLKRHGNRLKSGMMKYLTSVLRFQKSDKSSTLKTTGTNQSGADEYVITESDDITVSSLASPIYRPIKHTVNVQFTFSDLEAIQANKFGYITLSDTISGYLLHLKKKNGEDKAEISIIQKA